MAAMNYESLEHLAGDDRPNVLAALGWTRWMAGQGAEAMKFLDQALAIDQYPRPRNPFKSVIKRFNGIRCELQMPANSQRREHHRQMGINRILQR